MIKFTDIEGFHQIVKMLNKYDYLRPTKPITYRGKIKLHGTNGGVSIYPDGRVVAQSRTNELINGADNVGFAKWVAAHENEFKKLVSDKQIIIFGEWCGKGINKGCAIHAVVDKKFVVFMIQLGQLEDDTVLIQPAAIKMFLNGISDILILPWYEPAEIVIDFSNIDQMRNQLEKINALVLQVEACDPWVKDQFGVSGVGEGIVYYPQLHRRSEITKYMFKAKGEKHSVKIQKAPVILNPETVSSVAEFVRMFVTENRCQQGLTVACNNELDRKLTGVFLKWLCSDVLKESKVELEANNLTWDMVSGAVQKAAQRWWLDATTKI